MKKVMMMAVMAVLAIGMSGCGRFDRFGAAVTGAQAKSVLTGLSICSSRLVRV